MRIGRFAAALAVSCFLASAPSAWAADPVPSLDLRGFHPSTDPAANLYLEPTATPGHLKWNVAGWASYAHRLVTIIDANGQEVAVPVENQVSMDYSLGVGITDRLAFGALLPTV